MPRDVTTEVRKAKLKVRRKRQLEEVSATKESGSSSSSSSSSSISSISSTTSSTTTTTSEIALAARQWRRVEARLLRHEDAEPLTLAQQLMAEEEEIRPPAPARREEVLASLEPCQRAALAHVAHHAESAHGATLGPLRKRVRSLGFDVTALEELLVFIRSDAAIIIHLSEACLRLLVKDTHYRSQFETKTSGGTNNLAYRAQWEDAMFGGAYATCGATERPKYGCLNLTGDKLGVQTARAYGPLFLVLSSDVRYRTTFANQDTSTASAQQGLGTNEFCAHVLLKYSDADLTTTLRSVVEGGVAGAPPLMQYKEVQIHGPVDLRRDVQALSLPGSEQTATDYLKSTTDSFRALAGCNVLWQGLP